MCQLGKGKGGGLRVESVGEKESREDKELMTGKELSQLGKGRKGG